jgi:hypothetical protein
MKASELKAKDKFYTLLDFESSDSVTPIKWEVIANNGKVILAKSSLSGSLKGFYANTDVVRVNH